MSFEFIKMEKVLIDQKRRSDERHGVYEIPIRLSALPPLHWREIFERDVENNAWITAGHQVRLSGNKIVLCCPPEEAQKVVDALKPEIERINQEYAEWEEKEKVRSKDQTEEEREEEQRVNDILKNLKL